MNTALSCDPTVAEPTVAGPAVADHIGPAGRGNGCVPAALADYLGVVCAALARRGIGVLAVRVRPTRPPHALSASLELDPAGARPGLGWGPVSAVWHEELGWWAELRPGPGPARRYLPATTDRAGTDRGAAVAAYPSAVAEFVAGLARGADLGSMHPPPTRHRHPAGPRRGRDRSPR